MFLKSIEIQGFKSFADKTTLKFGKGITAVVGPNGSGKSNISDAVRWALGEQSTKNLRGHKMEDVVFDGTAERSPKGYAEVTLTIDNSDMQLNFDNDLVSVTRRYYRSGESDYQINKASVRLKDIHELFMDTGLGRDGYSMIGQGKIDNIVSSKSSERRDIFEEAAGISRFRYRKIESERQLFQAEENLLRLKDIMSELEDRIGPLKEQSGKAQEFIELANEKKELEIGLWLHTLSVSKDALRNQEYKITLADNQYNEIVDELKNIENENELCADNSVEITVKVDEIHRRSFELEEAVARTEGEIAVIENNIYHNNETLSRLKAEIESIGQSDIEAKSEIEEKQKEALDKSEMLDCVRTEINETLDKLQNINLDNEKLSKEIDEYVCDINLLSERSSDWRVKMVTAQSSLTEIELRSSKIKQTVSEMIIEKSKLEKEFEDINLHLNNINEQVEECSNSIKGYEIKSKTRKETCDLLKNKLDKIKSDVNDKNRRAQILQDLEQNMEGFSISVKSVMQESKLGRLNGVHGPVSRIINVPNKFSVAIEVALGAALQNIVVNNEQDAKHAISFLKTNNKGRATFLPISAIKGRRINEPMLYNEYGVIGIASELVKSKEKYSEILGSLLGRTVIAKDIDCAVSVAKKFGYRFKIVTLDGQVVNTGGSLTGGSLSKNTGLLSRAVEIERLKEEAKTLTEQMIELDKQYRNAVSELSQIEAEISSVKSVMKTGEEDKIRADAEIRRINIQSETCVNNIEALNNESSDSIVRINELKDTISKSVSEIQNVEKQKSIAQLEVDKISGGRENYVAFRDRLSDQLTNLKLQAIKYEKDIEVLNSSIIEIEESINDRVGTLSKIENAIAGVVNNNTEHYSKIDDLKKNIVELKTISKNSENEISELKLKKTDIEKHLLELRHKEKDYIDRREKTGGEKARLEERKEGMLREYDDVIKKLYDEYELTISEAKELGITIEKPAEAHRTLNSIKNKIKSLGNVNVAAIEEYKVQSVRYKFMSEQIADVENSRDELHKLIEHLTAKMREQFTEEFNKIKTHFSAIFTELFGGGSGDLKLSDPNNVLESGIEILVQPPGKKVSSIELLSGGEKALIALSIYFAIMKVNPPPFCMLDEVETALDDVNVDRFANYMHKLTNPTQFICITHRRGTMEAADMLYGVTMQEKGISKLLELNVAELEKKLLVSGR